LKILLSNKTVFTDIKKNVKVHENSVNDGNASSHFKGTIHENIIKCNRGNAETILLTFNSNIDGTPLTKSGKKGFWSLQVCINELSSKLKSKFILLKGLLMMDKESKSDLMNLYFSKFCDKIKHLFHNGIEVTHNKIKYSLKFCSLSFPVDSVCRPILQNRIQFNGYFGCSWYYQVGEYIKSVKGIRYIRD